MYNYINYNYFIFLMSLYFCLKATYGVGLTRKKSHCFDHFPDKKVINI